MIVIRIESDSYLEQFGADFLLFDLLFLEPFSGLLLDPTVVFPVGLHLTSQPLHPAGHVLFSFLRLPAARTEGSR